MTDWLAELLSDTALRAIPGAVAAGLIAGTLLPLLGLWVVMQRVVFLGVTLAQVAAAGAALGLVLGVHPLVLGLALSVAAVLGLGSLGKGRVAAVGDRTLGAFFCAASALALVFISRSPADLDQVQHVLHGNLIYASDEAIAWVGGSLLVALALIGVCFRPILFCAFDADAATAAGLSARRWLTLLFTVLALVLAVSMRTTGSLLSFAMLVLPGLAALQLRIGLRATFGAASGLGLLGTLAGLWLAVAGDLHVESSITLALFALVPICWGWRRHPGWGLGLTALALALGALAAQPPGEAVHAPHHHGGETHTETEAHSPYHLDLSVDGKRSADGARLFVRWDLDVHCVDPSAELPEQLWLVLNGDGVMLHEHELIHELRELPPGDSHHTGSFAVEVEGDIHRLDGQLWDASILEGLPLPLDRVSVLGGDVQR